MTLALTGIVAAAKPVLAVAQRIFSTVIQAVQDVATGAMQADDFEEKMADMAAKLKPVDDALDALDMKLTEREAGIEGRFARLRAQAEAARSRPE